MTFPLGSLRSETGAASASPTAAHGGTYTRSGATPASAGGLVHPDWKSQLKLFAGGVLWLLALLAMATHNAGDPAFSTSGSTPMARNAAGAFGAGFSDLAFFLLGYSSWWLMAIGLRAWLGGLARALRGDEQSSSGKPRWLFWAGVVLLIASSAALEWTRLYQWEPRLPGGHAGGVLGYTIGPLSMKALGFAGSGVLWIAGLVAGLAMAFRFSWLSVAERIGAWFESLRERRVERIERAEDIRLGAQAQREREQV